LPKNNFLYFSENKVYLKNCTVSDIPVNCQNVTYIYHVHEKGLMLGTFLWKFGLAFKLYWTLFCRKRDWSFTDGRMLMQTLDCDLTYPSIVVLGKICFLCPRTVLQNILIHVLNEKQTFLRKVRASDILSRSKKSIFNQCKHICCRKYIQRYKHYM